MFAYGLILCSNISNNIRNTNIPIVPLWALPNDHASGVINKAWPNLILRLTRQDRHGDALRCSLPWGEENPRTAERLLRAVRIYVSTEQKKLQDLYLGNLRILNIFLDFCQLLRFLVKITWFLSFSGKNDAESLCHFVKIPFLDPKRAKLDQKSEIGHVRTCPGGPIMAHKGPYGPQPGPGPNPGPGCRLLIMNGACKQGSK